MRGYRKRLQKNLSRKLREKRSRYLVLFPVKYTVLLPSNCHRFEGYEMDYLSGNMFNYLRNRFHIKEYDKHNLT